jgi:hypothetical protein
VVDFLQGVTLLLGTLASVWVTRKIARQPLRQLWPQYLAIAILTLSLGWIIV